MELVRRTLKRVLPRKAYGYAANIVDHLALLRLGGPRLLRDLRPTTARGLATVQIPGIEHPLTFRTGTPDVAAITQNIVRQEWGGIELPFEPSTLVDAGAFIGDVAVYFLAKYPHCRVIALEPNADNFAVAEINLAPYGDRVSLMRAALWDKCEPVNMRGASWGAGIAADGETLVDGIDMHTVLAQNGIGRVDVLKLDIEGAEDRVLGPSAHRWLQGCRAVLAEFHGHDKRRECTSNLMAAGFHGNKRRSVHFFLRS